MHDNFKIHDRRNQDLLAETMNKMLDFDNFQISHRFSNQAETNSVLSWSSMSSVFEDEESKKIDKKFFTKRQNSFDWDDTVMSTVEKKSQSSQLQTNVPPLGLITQRLFYDLAPVPTPQMRNYARKCSSNLCAPRTPDDDPPTEINLQNVRSNRLLILLALNLKKIDVFLPDLIQFYKIHVEEYFEYFFSYH